MTRKHYVRLAEELHVEYKYLDSMPREGFMIAVNTVCDALKRENPRFDRDRFLAVVRGPDL